MSVHYGGHCLLCEGPVLKWVWSEVCDECLDAAYDDCASPQAQRIAAMVRVGQAAAVKP